MNKAVEAARAAFPGWSGATPEVRADLLDKVGSLIIERKDALGKLLASEEGKTLPEATGETVRAGRIFKYFAGEALRRHGQNLEFGAPRRRNPDLSRSRRRLWPDHAVEFPDRHSGLEDRAGAGLRQHRGAEVRQSDPGDRACAGRRSSMKPARRPVSSTWCWAAALSAMRFPSIPMSTASPSPARRPWAPRSRMAAVSHQARVQMEMGGKNPLVVLDDAEFDRAVQIAVDGGYFATGQRCTASSRVFVQDGIYDKFVAARGRTRQGAEGGQCAGSRPPRWARPSPTPSSRGNLKYVDIALKEGGRLLAGGAEPLKLATPGHYMSPDPDRGHQASATPSTRKKCSVRSCRW